MAEKQVDRALCQAVKEAGGIARKFGVVGAHGASGYPDRDLFFPGGLLYMVECKAPGKWLTELQVVRHEELRTLGQRTFVYDREGISAARDFVAYLLGRCNPLNPLFHTFGFGEGPVKRNGEF